MFMKCSFKTILVSAFLSVLACSVLAQGNETYYTLDEMPDASVFLPCPPAFESAGFAIDFMRWQWGRSVRCTDRGMMASDDSEFGIDCMVKIFGPIFGIEISEEGTPAIWKLMYRVGTTGRLSVTKAKAKYMRIRPFTKMNEHTFGKYDDEESLRYNGSYPSGHTVFGWSVALALAELVPEYQDTILCRGLLYGDSRVIVGAHWQSDVDAARLAASAALAKLHTSQAYILDLVEARKEFVRLKEIKAVTIDTRLPNSKNILQALSQNNDYEYYGDVADQWLTQHDCDSIRKLQAIIDADLSDTALMKGFSPCLHVFFSKKNTPYMATLLSSVTWTIMHESNEVGKCFFLEPPCTESKDTAFARNEQEINTFSSFPSEQAAVGWGLALLFAEIAPNLQDSILLRGFEYGRSGIITGDHYSSDTQAGRFMASYIYTQLHNNSGFQALLNAAKKEYASVSQKAYTPPDVHKQ